MDDYDRAAILGGELQAALADIRFPLAASVESDIQRRVCEYTVALKRVGIEPERVLMAVKYLANQAGVYATAHLVAPHDQLHGRDKLLVDMIGWCLGQYHADTPRSD